MIGVRAAGLVIGLPLLLSGCSTVPVGVVGLTLRDGRPVVLVHSCHEQVDGVVILDGARAVVTEQRFGDGTDDGEWVLPVDVLPATGGRIAARSGSEVVGPAMPVTPAELALLRADVVRFSENRDPFPNPTATVEDDEGGFKDRACDATGGFVSDVWDPPTASPSPQSPSPAR